MSQSQPSRLGVSGEVLEMGARFSARFRVYYEDTDGTGVVYHANYLRFFERARTDWLRAAGFNQAQLSDEQSVVFTVAEVTLKFLAPAILDDLLDIDVRIASSRRASMIFDQRIVLAERAGIATSSDPLTPEAAPSGVIAGHVLSTATVEVACIQRTTMKPCRMPAPLLEVLARDH